MLRRGSSSGQGRGRPRKHDLPPHICTSPTVSTAPASTTSTAATTSTTSSHSPHTQKFVMISNPKYVESRPQPSFPPQPSLPPSLPLGGEACTSLVPDSTPSPTPRQPGLQSAQASSSTPSACGI